MMGMGELYRYEDSTPLWTSFENPDGARGSGGRENGGAKGRPSRPFAAGEEKVLLDVRGEGIVRRIWFTLSDRSPEVLKAVRLRIVWDGADSPAVDVPIADFFCLGGGRMAAFQNALFSSPEGRSFNCHIPMPFRAGARISLVNLSGKALTHLFYDVNATLESLPAGSLYFHAIHTVTGRGGRAITDDVPVLPSVGGRGRFLGANITVNFDPIYAESWFGEGEVKVYFGGERYPTLVGTGTEDYVGAAWGLGEYVNHEQGCTCLNKEMAAFYRYHLRDPIFFGDGLRVDIQNIGGARVSKALEIRNRGADMLPAYTDAAGIATHLFGRATAADIDGMDPEHFLCFYRRDDYECLAYLYHEAKGRL